MASHVLQKNQINNGDMLIQALKLYFLCNHPISFESETNSMIHIILHLTIYNAIHLDALSLQATTPPRHRGM